YNAVVALLSMRKFLKERGIEDSLQALKSKGSDYTLDPKERERWGANAEYLGKQIVAATGSESKEKALLKTIDSELIGYLGSTDVVSKLQALFDQNEDLSLQQFQQFLEANKAAGSAHKKHEALKDKGDLNLRLETARYPLEATTSDPKVLSKLSSDVDRMTLSYQRGKELFIAQACYACHRIEGFARGGIGPELTLEGEREPWFIKESIVWPQADLKTSTMPNFRLDHEEVEDLMTFLLAQRLDRRSESEMTRRVQVKAWEAGKKAPWEEPVSPAVIRDVRKSMTVFATEGCAACHRLKGFESNYGFTVEKEDPDFDRLFTERQWFQKLFPEEMLGSEIVRAVKTHASEIDARISPDVRQGALLDELEERYPGLVETFYTNFKFALRAQDHLGDEEYKERVRRVLMMYVQEYGFGRLIGPRPNWSGVYRSDQWLMEHFWNPASLVARSIMPVFPFDNTKFLALTYMLDVLGRQNTLQLREIWQNKGFSPSMAYQTLCAQCHGENFKGNGPVAEWIYPIPKNLSNPVFLRNLTKDRAYNSLVHGIKGGPMPPWGEVAMDKPFADQPPVLTGEEITELVNWIFRSLPGERYLREQQEIRKWDYSPEDVIKELRDTGDVKKLKEGVSTLLKDQPLIASIKPVASSFTVEDVFDKVPAPEGDPEPYLYYIKEKYYTPQNLAQGKAFFELNCAVCHGKDADGAGARAEVMEDAKPRMLINLPWLESRDDLRLIRSLVYGVAGTSMTPWGDQTTALQRLQLVMYIRSLTKTKRDYKKLKNALYQDFQASVWVVEQAREKGVKEIERLKKQAMELRIERLQKEEAALFGEERSVVAELYNQELDLREKLAVLQKGDDTLNSMITLLKKERDLYQDKGNALFSLYGETPIFTEFVRLIDISGNLYSLEEGTLALRAVNTEKEGELRVAILAALDGKIEELSTQKKIASGKIPS
ncbi:MAG: c-type cytochrome, partial [Chlamydiia bacterium]|nr:c-type cytochrome [Chlamydiia bacterium]